MSLQRQRGYYFATAAQWKACLMSRADISSIKGGTKVWPFPPYQSIAAPTFASQGAFAPAFSRSHGVLWHDGVQQLHRVGKGDDLPDSVLAPVPILRARRMIATSEDLWVAGEQRTSLQCFDAETLSRRFVVEIAGARIIDIAADMRNGVVAMVERGGILECVRVDNVGTISEIAVLEAIFEARAFTSLRELGGFAVLSQDGQQLCWFSGAGGAPPRRTRLATLAACFVADTVASDARKRVFVAGADHTSESPVPRVLVLDSDGALIDDVALHEPVTGLAATRDSILVTTQRGLYWLSVADPIPPDGQEVRAVILTPVMEGPDAEDGRRWLRAELVGDLPPGATMEIACITARDEAERDRLRAIADDASVPANRRLQQLRAEGTWRNLMVFHGDGPSKREAGLPLAVPLYDVRDKFLWICITLIAGAGARLPALSQLSVLYPGRTLMERLPSIYQRDESEPGNFLRALVGVLETTSQSLDASIAAMAGNIHPHTAPADWLDFTARWLGLPWDDALDLRQKRCIVTHAAQIAEGRGTRAGFETLLACLLPDSSTPRFRIADMSVDYGFAMLGGRTCRGSSLPVLLGGLPRSAARLGVRATLGRMRLPCGDTEENATSRFIGMIRIDVTASAQEKEQWSPWFENVLSEMVPITARMTVRWLGIDALRSDRLDETLMIEAPARPQLGTNAIMGRTRLPDRGATLPISVSDSGPALH